MSGAFLRFAVNAHGGFEEGPMMAVASIRRACGPDVGVLAYRPDNLAPLSERARRFFDRHGVEVRAFHNDFLPDRLEDPAGVPARHLTMNKLWCVRDLEPGERRVFLDADTLLLADPARDLLDVEEPAAAAPVDTPEAFGGDWARLYEALGVPFPERRVEVWERYGYGDAPEPPRVEMVPYVNSGVVAVEAGSALPEAWMRTCREIERRLELVPRTFFVDQIALSVALHRTGEPWRLLPRRFNCTYEVFRYVDDPAILHYVTIDTLAAAVGRFPAVEAAARDVVGILAADGGPDLRLRVMTEWPRRARRLAGILSRRVLRPLGLGGGEAERA